MCHDGQSGILEKLLQSLSAVNKHIARRRTHEQFYARHYVAVNTCQFFSIVVSCAYEESIVHGTHLCCTLQFSADCFSRCGLRHSVWHIEERSHSSACRLSALALHVSLVRHARFTEMHMRVDDARKNKTPREVYGIVVVFARRHI